MHIIRAPDAISNKGRNPVVSTSEGALVYRAPKDSPYEMFLVWYGMDNKATRILAFHRARPTAEEKDIADALNRDWGKNVATLGFIRRQLPASGSQLGAYYWNDDRVRVKTWAETNDNGQRLLTEWRYWPVAVDKLTK